MQLSTWLGYLNAFLHKEPHLDINAVSDEFAGRFDFVISGDMFEHIDPSVSQTFSGFAPATQAGRACHTYIVQWAHAYATVVHFFRAYQYQIEHDDQERLLYNTTYSGQKRLFRNLQFHGGEEQICGIAPVRAFHSDQESSDRRNICSDGVRSPPACEEITFFLSLVSTVFFARLPEWLTVFPC